MTDEHRPRVGGLFTDHRAICSYGGVTPGQPICEQPAVLHVILASEAAVDPHGLVGVLACVEHAPTARVVGKFVAEHAFMGICSLPGSMWLPAPNICVIDDSGVEPELVAAEEMVVGG